MGKSRVTRMRRLGYWLTGSKAVAARQYTLAFLRATLTPRITRWPAGELVEAAESLACDVVISKPRFCDGSGHALPNIAWSIDDIIATLKVTQQRKLQQLEAVMFAAELLHVRAAIKWGNHIVPKL